MKKKATANMRIGTDVIQSSSCEAPEMGVSKLAKTATSAASPKIPHSASRPRYAFASWYWKIVPGMNER